MTKDRPLTFEKPKPVPTSPADMSCKHPDDIAMAEDDFEPTYFHDHVISIVALGFVALVLINLVCIPLVAATWLIGHLIK